MSTTPTTNRVPPDPTTSTSDPPLLWRFGYWTAVATGGLTVVTFALALTALPDKVPYPFAEQRIADQWPGDYLWMYPATALMLVLLALVAALHQYAAPDRRVFTSVALALATMAATVLMIDYFVQVTVMQPSLEKAQLDGWAILTQYNPNGVFIALEELGYMLTSLALLCTVPALGGNGRASRALRVLLPASSALVVVSLAAVSATRGIDRADVFEIAVISIVWTTLIVASPLFASVFCSGRRA